MKSATGAGVSGFTLIELLVAVLILAVVGSMAYRGLAAVQESERHVSALALRWQEIARGVERMGRDLRQAGERQGRDAAGGALPSFLGNKSGSASADAPSLAFTRLGEGGADTRRVGYRLRQGNLEILLWPTPEAAGLAPRNYTLLAGVRELAFAYLDDVGNWHDAWPVPGKAALPRAVRVRLALAEGTSLERFFDLP